MTKSTLNTAISIANSAFGSAIIIFPINYLKYGIIENLIFLVIMSVLMALTCSIYGMHIRPSEKQIIEIIKRILGQKFFKVITFFSVIQLILVSSIYFLLASDVLFDVLQDIDKNLFSNQKLFKSILLLLFAVFTLPKNLNLVFKIAPFAMGLLIISILILIGSFPFNISNLDSGIITLKPFNFQNLLLVASINSFAFTCHSSISPILKAHKDQANNKKAIFLGFLMMALTYTFVGIGGCLAIYGKPSVKSQNVMDYFQGEWQSFAIGFLNFFYFLCIIPIFPFVAKTQFITFLPEKFSKDSKIFIKVTVVFVIVWLIINFLFIILETNASLVMGFLGSAVCYFFTYLIPILVVLKVGKTLYTRQAQGPTNSPQSQEQNTIIFSKNKKIQDSLKPKNDDNIDNIDQNINTDLIDKNETNIFRDKGYIIKSYLIEKKQKIGYGIMLLFGSAMFVSEIGSIIFDLFQQIQ